MFRHGYVCVNRGAGIASPRDLAGKRIGVPLYTMTAAVYIRGVLQEEYGVDFSNVQWVQGAVNGTGSHGDPQAPPLLKPVDIVRNDDGRSLSDLLDEGAIDAYLGSRLPASLDRGNVERLFPDFRAVEREYLSRTGIFPIMHLVVIRRDVLQRHPFVARSLFDAFESARRAAWRRLEDTGTLACMLPWMRQDVEEMKRLFPGGDPWVYGVEPNRPALETLLRYLLRQDMIARPMTVEELFPVPL
ncbi:ABC transporter substrate-binding protein [Pigmentiphaga sp. GD03639]|uniref:SsuA/THI5-like domain-containing protein n=1 Tax=Pigmentiphaga daeguensis TaxID=414049 RepID=A0ABN1BJ24_9BURK|nr:MULTISPECIES: ABC transporter substrate-binding protein [unclassified Pigmentiphaga]MDH2234951.1 ABC transporter substrate-binding protein [Pigmentiphaga sp. GD03639]